MGHHKIELNRSIHYASGDVNNHGDCFYYGQMGGCDEECPVMLRGECEIYDKNFEEVVK